MLATELPRPPESVTELLSLDHRRLDAILAEAKRLAVAGDLASAAARFGEFRRGLEHHIAAEEEVLFPAFEALTGMRGGGPIHVMRLEHAEIKALLAEIAASLAHADAEDRTPRFAALTATLFAHNGKEERILYPMTDQAAGSDEGRRDLARQVQLF